jgi:hypothetical protein
VRLGTRLSRRCLAPNARRLLAAAAALVLLAACVACAGTRASSSGAPVSLTLVKFEDGRPGGGVGQVTSLEFMDSLRTALGRSGFDVVLVEDPSQAATGLAVKGVIDELPKTHATPKKGRVSFLATVFVGGREVYSRTYSEQIFSHEGQDVADQALKRAMAVAFADLARDIKTASRNASDAPGPRP